MARFGLAASSERSGEASPSSRLGELVDGWLFQLGTTKPAANTLAAYRRDLEGVARRIAADAEVAVLHLEHLTKEALRAAFASRAADHAAASVLRAHSSWSRFFDMVEGNPMARGAQASPGRRGAPGHPRSRRRRSAAGHGGPARPPRAQPLARARSGPGGHVLRDRASGKARR
jgi:hypothetical protein